MKKWVIERDDHGFISVCLPQNIYSKELIDITSFTDMPFKKFLDIKTNETHDCKKYYDVYIKEANELHK